MEPSKTSAAKASPDLATIVGDVLGDLAFLVSDDERPALPLGVVWLECRISYSGPVSGTLRCWCTQGFASQLAANLLGTRPDDDAVHDGVGDALGEFMNVVCGQLVTAWHGLHAVFGLSIPMVSECRETPCFDLEQRDGACALSISGEPFYCRYEPDHG
jgi:hypothetical protein